jgi:hypothetical protein
MEILSRVSCLNCSKTTLALMASYLQLVFGMWSGQFSCVRVRYGLEGGEGQTAALEVGLNEIGCRRLVEAYGTVWVRVLQA